jgi:3-oxoacyl-[acyl-carrier protein] reductase
MKALVTGGSRGIGAAIVSDLHQRGFEVVAPSRDDLDLSDLSQVEAFARENTEFAPQVLILNGGENNPLDIEHLSTDHWTRTMDVNVNSAFILIREFAPRMAVQGGGWITAVSSCYSVRSRRGRAPYAASKAALNSLIRSAAVEYAGSNILVNAVAPGFVMTDLTRQNNDANGIRILEDKIPMGRLAEPNEIAKLVGFLSSSTNTYITGQFYAIDGGFLCQ